MASKALLVFALLFAAAFLVASANEQTQAKEEESKQVYGRYLGGGGDYPYGGSNPYGDYPAGGGPGGYYGGPRGGRGRYRGRGRGCFRPYDAPPEVQN